MSVFGGCLESRVGWGVLEGGGRGGFFSGEREWR